MAITFTCECGKTLRAADADAGVPTDCPVCGRSLVVPAPHPPVAEWLPPPVPPPVPPVDSPPADLFREILNRLSGSWAFVSQVFRYYIDHAPALWKRYATADEDPREIALLAAEEYKTASLDATGWTVRIPGVCVVCGQFTDAPDVSETRQVEDLSRPLWFPVGFGVAGVLASFWFWSAWPLPLFLMTGLVIGYLRRTGATVRTTVKRCPEHQNFLGVPKLRSVGEDLYVAVGHRKVCEVFKSKNELNADGRRPRRPATAPELTGWEQHRTTSHPESIPLDDDPPG